MLGISANRNLTVQQKAKRAKLLYDENPKQYKARYETYKKEDENFAAGDTKRKIKKALKKGFKLTVNNSV